MSTRKSIIWSTSSCDFLCAPPLVCLCAAPSSKQWSHCLRQHGPTFNHSSQLSLSSSYVVISVVTMQIGWVLVPLSPAMAFQQRMSVTPWEWLILVVTRAIFLIFVICSDSLSHAELDFQQLGSLDQQIKSYNVTSNPYTWFTMETLEETWRNLQKIMKVWSQPCCAFLLFCFGFLVSVQSLTQTLLHPMIVNKLGQTQNQTFNLPGAWAGASERATSTGGERQTTSGVCSTCQHLPPMAHRDQVTYPTLHRHASSGHLFALASPLI